MQFKKRLTNNNAIKIKFLLKDDNFKNSKIHINYKNTLNFI